MTISYTALLGLAQPVTGTETGQWGTVVNDEITALLEDAVANSASISVTAGNVTLSATNGSSNQARMSTLIITGTPGTTRNVVAPSQAKIYVVINQSDGAVVIKGAATSGVTIGAGQTAQVAWNGSDFVEIGNYVHGNFVVNGNLSVNGDSTLGNAGADTTTINGQVIAANSNISKTTTLSASAPALAWIKGATYTDTGTAGGTTQALAPFTVFSAPTLSTSNIVTYTNAATVYVAGAPAAAGSATITNPYALYVAAGDAYFGASVVLNAGTANGVPYLSSPGKVLTTGSALTFDGTTLGTSGLTVSTNRAQFKGNTSTGFTGGSVEIGYTGTVGVVNTYDRTASAYKNLEIYGNDIYNYVKGSNAIWDIAGVGETMRLTSTGLGIGQNSPSGKLDVAGDAGVYVRPTGVVGTYLRFTAGAANGNTTIIADATSGAYPPLVFNTGGGERARISSDGTFRVKGAGTAGSTDAVQFSGSAPASALLLDSSGNLGLGVTPSAWYTGYTASQIGVNGSVWANRTTADTNIVGIGSNQFLNSGATNRLYISDGFATRYEQANGAHSWFTAPSGTADGTAATSLTSAQNGNSYTIKVAGTTDFTLIGAANNNVGTTFTKSGGTGAGTGTVSQNISFTQAMTLDASGNLGVGATSPNFRLEVRGSTVTNGDAIRNMAVISTNSASAGLGGGIAFGGYYNGTTNDINDFAGIQGFKENGAAGDYAGALRFTTRVNGGTPTERARITSVGGFETRPAANGHAVFNEDGVDADFRVESDTDTHCLFVDASANNVGIGTNNPGQKLTVAGAIAATSNSGSANTNYATFGLYTGGAIPVTYIQMPSGGATEFWKPDTGAVVRITNVGNVKIGGTADRATTEGTAQLVLFNGTAPVGTLANGVSFYSAAGEANVMDAAGNATLLSPHDAETNEWIFRSKHTPTGKVLKIDVERLLKFVNDHFGLDAVHEFIEK